MLQRVDLDILKNSICMSIIIQYQIILDTIINVRIPEIYLRAYEYL